MPAAKPFISIVVPICNEQTTIERLARSLLDQDYPHDRYEILNGRRRSSERTGTLLSRVDIGARVDVLDNLKRMVLMLANAPCRMVLIEASYSSVAVDAVRQRTLQTRVQVEFLQTESLKTAVLDPSRGRTSPGRRTRSPERERPARFHKTDEGTELDPGSRMRFDGHDFRFVRLLDQSPPRGGAATQRIHGLNRTRAERVVESPRRSPAVRARSWSWAPIRDVCAPS